MFSSSIFREKLKQTSVPYCPRSWSVVKTRASKRPIRRVWKPCTGLRIPDSTWPRSGVPRGCVCTIHTQRCTHDTGPQGLCVYGVWALHHRCRRVFGYKGGRLVQLLHSLGEHHLPHIEPYRMHTKVSTEQWVFFKTRRSKRSKDWLLIPFRLCWRCWAWPWCCPPRALLQLPNQPRSPPSSFWAPSSASTSTTCSPLPPATTATCSGSQAGRLTQHPQDPSVLGPTTISSRSSGYFSSEAKVLDERNTRWKRNVAMNEISDWNPWRSQGQGWPTLPPMCSNRYVSYCLLKTNIY